MSGEEDIVISWGARLFRSLRAKPLRTLAVLLLVAAGPALGADSFDGVYSDKRVLTKGSTQQCIHYSSVSNIGDSRCLEE